jgi:hypothetical protein
MYIRWTAHSPDGKAREWKNWIKQKPSGLIAGAGTTVTDHTADGGCANANLRSPYSVLNFSEYVQLLYGCAAAKVVGLHQY